MDCFNNNINQNLNDVNWCATNYGVQQSFSLALHSTDQSVTDVLETEIEIEYARHSEIYDSIGSVN